MLLGHTNPIEMLVYWAAQMIGCIIGALWLALLVPGLYIGAPSAQKSGYIALGNDSDGCFYPTNNMSIARVFGWEAFCTFCFILPIFSVVWYTLHKKGYGNTGPLMVGLSLIANAMAAGRYTGAALNPARVLASPAVFSCDNTYLFYYVAGEFLGASLVPIIIAPWYGISPNAWYIAAVPEKAKTYFDNVKNTRERGFSVLEDIMDLQEKMTNRDSNNSDELAMVSHEYEVSPMGGRGSGYGSDRGDMSYHLESNRTGEVIQLTVHPTSRQAEKSRFCNVQTCSPPNSSSPFSQHSPLVPSVPLSRSVSFATPICTPHSAAMHALAHSPANVNVNVNANAITVASVSAAAVKAKAAVDVDERNTVG
jgi:hypothetical protein